MAPLSLHFETVFWSQKQPGQAAPDFHTGLQILYQKLSQSEVENEEIIHFFKERIAIEQAYATRLSNQAKVLPRSSGFGRDDGAGLKTCFALFRETSAEFGQTHSEAGARLSDECLKPLQTLQNDYKSTLSNQKKSIDTILREFDGLVRETERARVLYGQRCRAADAAEERALKETDSNNRVSLEETATTPTTEAVQLGQQTLTAAELDTLVREMRQGIPAKEYRATLFKRYQNTSTGEDISSWLQKNLAQCKDSPAMADSIGQQLISFGILQPTSQSANTFEASVNAVFQWRINSDEESANTPGNGTSTSSYAFGGLFDRIGTIRASPLQNPGEERHKKARSDAEQTDQIYRNAVLRVDQMRNMVEESLFEHFAALERAEIKRITILKEVFLAFATYLNQTLMPGDKKVAEKMTAYQESLKPNDDVQYIVHQYCVSSFSPKVILYDNHYHSSALDQIFGVPLKELGKQSKSNVPHFITRTLEAIEQGYKDLEKDKQWKVWSTPLQLTRVHALRSQFNLPSDNLSDELFLQLKPDQLASLLRLYFLELPECLMTLEFYDAAQALYSNNEHDTSLRLPTLSNLIATLPGAHFATLIALLNHLKKNLQESEALAIQDISNALGPVVIRPRHESFATLSSRMPSLVFKDCLQHYADIFTEATLQSHAESEKRRQAQPLVVELPAPEIKSRNPLKSLIRSASMKEKSPSSPTSPSVLPSPIASSFITQSPPASPKASPMNEIMFNVEDHIEGEQQDTLNDELDPFFADD